MLLRVSAFAIFMPLLLSPGGASTAIESPLSELSWMAGCWQMQHGARLIEEQWMSPVGAIMPGMGRTSVEGEVRAYEHLLIRQDDQGLVYRAMPSGQAAAEFRSIEQTERSISFANPEHDFPQRISYRSAAGGDSLLAEISGDLRGQARVIAFPYRRTACPE